MEPLSVHLLCVLTNELIDSTDCLLTKEDWKLLFKVNSSLALCRAPAESAHEVEQSDEKPEEVVCILILEEEVSGKHVHF